MIFSGEFWRDVSQPRGEPRCATLWALIKFAISSLSSLPFAHFRTFLLSFCSFSPSGTWKSFDLGDFPRADLQAAAPGRNPARRTQLFKMYNPVLVQTRNQGHRSVQKLILSSSRTVPRAFLALGGDRSHFRIRQNPRSKGFALWPRPR